MFSTRAATRGSRTLGLTRRHRPRRFVARRATCTAPGTAFAEKPFNLTPDPKYLYLSRRHAEAFAHLEFGQRERGGFILITGEVGTGKTTLARYFLGKLGPRHRHRASCSTPRSPPRSCCARSSTTCTSPAEGNSLKDLVDALHRFLLEARAARAQRGPADRRGPGPLAGGARAGPPHLEPRDRHREADPDRAHGPVGAARPAGAPRAAAARPARDRALPPRRPLARRRRRTTSATACRWPAARARCASTTPRSSPCTSSPAGIPRLVNLICDRSLLAGYVAGSADDHRRDGRARPRRRCRARTARTRALAPGLGAAALIAAAWRRWRSRAGPAPRARRRRRRRPTSRTLRHAARPHPTPTPAPAQRQRLDALVRELPRDASFAAAPRPRAGTLGDARRSCSARPPHPPRAGARVRPAGGARDVPPGAERHLLPRPRAPRRDAAHRRDRRRASARGAARPARRLWTQEAIFLWPDAQASAATAGGRPGRARRSPAWATASPSLVAAVAQLPARRASWPTASWGRARS